MHGSKSAILAIFQEGPGWPCPDSDRIPHRISKILFAFGADEFLAMLEGKTKSAHFSKIQSGNITVWIANSTKLVSTCCCVGLVFNSLKKPDKRSEKMKKANNSTTRYFLHCYQTLPLDLIYLLKGDTF